MNTLSASLSSLSDNISIAKQLLIDLRISEIKGNIAILKLSQGK